MRRFLGAGFLGLALLGAPAAAIADDMEGQDLPAMEEEGSNRPLVIGAIVAAALIGGGIVLGRRG